MDQTKLYQTELMGVDAEIICALKLNQRSTETYKAM